MPHEVQSSIPVHKSRTPKVEGVSKLSGARVTGAASRGRRLTWQRCGMGQRTHAAAWLFQWWERVPGRRINGSGPERAPCRWATPEHEQERDAGLQALSHWWLRETYCRILCQAPVKQVTGAHNADPKSPSGWRGGLTILHERVLDQKHRVERGFRSIFDHYRHHSYTADGYSA